jgi:hypothetical protein
MTKNILILIDVWDKLTEEAAQQKKENICQFINRIANHPNWTIYYNDVDCLLDAQVSKCLLAASNAVCTNDPNEIFFNRDHSVTYYYGGFSANVCLMYRSIGINQMFKQANNYKFFIVSDFTCATKIKYDVVNDPAASRKVEIELFDLENLKYHKIDEFDSNFAKYYDFENILTNMILSNATRVDQILLD